MRKSMKAKGVPEKPPFDEFMAVKDIFSGQILFSSYFREDIAKFVKRFPNPSELHVMIVGSGWIEDEFGLRGFLCINDAFSIPKA